VRGYVSCVFVSLGMSSLAWAAQNNAKDFEDVKPPVMFQEGFYGIERSKQSSWRWMGDVLAKAGGPVPLKGTVLLLNTKKDTVLKIAAIVPKMPATPTIKFYFNGKRLDEFKLTKDRFEKSYKIPAARQGQDEYSELLLTTDQFRIPMEVEKNSMDSRRLGIRVTKLTWDGSEGIPPAVVEAPRPETAMPIVETTNGSSTGGWLAVFLPVATVVFLVVLAFAIYQTRRMRASRQPGEHRSKPAEGAAPFVSFECSHCGKALKAKAELQGRKIKCPHCKQTVLAAQSHRTSPPLA
jgi:DNA-directed RNA polymerase subunit RPC12/RpoP